MSENSLEKASKDVQEKQKAEASGMSLEDAKPADGIPEEIKKVAESALRIFDESHSEEIGDLALALSKAQGACHNGSKDTAGYNYKYMTLNQLIDIMRKPFSDNELAILQSHELIKHATNPRIVTYTTVMHSSGQWHKSALEIPMTIMNNLTPAQMIGMVCTYARRYTLQALALITSEEDTDSAPKAAKK